MRSALLSIALLALSFGRPAAGAAPSAEPDVQFYHPSDFSTIPAGSAVAKLAARAPKGAIPGLVWKSYRRELVERTDANDEVQLYAEARGVLSGANRGLLFGSRRVALNREGEFVADFPITAEAQAFRLTAIDPHGNTQVETVFVEVRRFAQLKAERQTLVGRPHPWSFGISVTSLRYMETGISQVNQPSLTVKGGYMGSHAEQGWLSRVNYGLSAFITALPLSSSDPNASMRFLGVNLRAAYAFPHLFGADSSWSATIGLGYYYTTMFVSAANPDDIFGFSGLAGFQLFPTLQKTLTPRDSIAAYFKYAPISEGLALSGLGTNREIAFGLTYRRHASSARDWLVTFDCSNLQFQTGNSLIQSTSFGIGTGIGW